MSERMYTNRQLIRLLLPLLVEQLLVILVGMADTVMVSSLGDAAVSGVSLVDQFCYVIIVLFAALATGGAVVASQLLGAKRGEEACRVSNQLFMVTALAAAVIMVPVLVFRRPIFGVLFGDTEESVFENAMTYLFITAWSYPFIAVYNAGAALFRSMGKSGITMRVSMLVNAVNIVGNALGVFVFKIGVAGVAFPTLISRAVGALCMVILLRDKGLELHLVPGAWKPEMRSIREILRIGIPNGIENSLFQFGRLLVVGIIAAFGTVQIAANAVANTMDTLGCLSGQAMNLAIITVIGQCVGAGDYTQARYYVRKLLLWTYVATWCVNSTVILTMRWTLPLFGVSDEALSLARTLAIMHNGMAMLLWPTAFTLPNALRAASDVKYTMVVSLASMAIFRIGFSYVLGMGLGWGAVGVWTAMIIDWVCRVTCFVIRYRGHAWETKATIKAKQQ